MVHGGADQSLEGVGRSVIFPEMKRKAKTAGQNLSKKTKMALGGLGEKKPKKQNKTLQAMYVLRIHR